MWMSPLIIPNLLKHFPPSHLHKLAPLHSYFHSFVLVCVFIKHAEPVWSHNTLYYSTRATSFSYLPPWRTPRPAATRSLWGGEKITLQIRFWVMIKDKHAYARAMKSEARVEMSFHGRQMATPQAVKRMQIASKSIRKWLGNTACS